MRDLGTESNSSAAAAYDGRNVELQKRIIAAMRFDDPHLPQAFALLRQMERAAADAEIARAFSRVRPGPLALNS